MIPGFTPIEGSYSNHVGGGMTHPVTGTVYFLVTWRQNSAGLYYIQLWEDAAPYGDPKMIRQWAGDPWGYGTATWLPNGSLYVIAPGNVDGGGVKPAIHIEPGVFPAIPLGGVPGPAGPKGATGATGPQGPQGVPGPAGSGSGALTPDQARVLNYMVGVYGPLLNS